MCVSFHSVHYLCVVYVYVNVEDIFNVYIDVSINKSMYIYIHILCVQGVLVETYRFRYIWISKV